MAKQIIEFPPVGAIYGTDVMIATRAAFTASGFDARLSCMQAATAMTGSYIAFGN